MTLLLKRSKVPLALVTMPDRAVRDCDTAVLLDWCGCCMTYLSQYIHLLIALKQKLFMLFLVV